MDRRDFMKGAMAAGVTAMMPASAVLKEPSNDCIADPPSGPAIGEAGPVLNEPVKPVWIADGNGWRQVPSLLDVKKGDIFVRNWPIRSKAIADGAIDLADGRDGVLAISFSHGGPSVFPPFPWCARCGDPREVPPEERKDVDEVHRKVCDPCAIDPGRADRKLEAYVRFLKLNPPVRIT